MARQLIRVQTVDLHCPAVGSANQISELFQVIVVNCTINTSQYNEYIQLALGMTVLFELLLLTCGNYYSSCSDKKVSLQARNCLRVHVAAWY